METIISYFQSMYDFFIDNFYIIPAVVLSTFAIEAIVFLILGFVKAHDGKGFHYNYEAFFMVASLSLLGFVVLYALAAFGFTFVNRMKELDWNFWGNYWNFTCNHMWYPITLFVINGIVAVVGAIKGMDGDLFGAILGFILGAVAGAAALGVIFLVIFLLYVIVAILINFFIALGYGFAGFGVSIVKFFQLNWFVMTSVIIAPGLFTGLAVALRNYLGILINALHNAKKNHFGRHKTS